MPSHNQQPPIKPIFSCQSLLLLLSITIAGSLTASPLNNAEVELTTGVKLRGVVTNRSYSQFEFNVGSNVLQVTPNMVTKRTWENVMGTEEEQESRRIADEEKEHNARAARVRAIVHEQLTNSFAKTSGESSGESSGEKSPPSDGEKSGGG
jgi:molybdopterin-binding protein